MKRRIGMLTVAKYGPSVFVALGLIISGSAAAPPAPGPEETWEQLLNKQGQWMSSTSMYRLTWDGRLGETYFVQYSATLNGDWLYVPLVTQGVGAYEFDLNSSGSVGFLRVLPRPSVGQNAETDDPDGDGIGSLAEINATPQTDPLKFDTDGNGVRDGGEDADGNGLGDGWEIAHFGSVGQSATADPDNDGLSNLDEYGFATDPNVDSAFKDSSSQVYQYDLGKLKSSQVNGVQSLIFSYSSSGNILTVTTSN